MAGARRLQTVAETRAFADDIDAMLPPAACDLVYAKNERADLTTGQKRVLARLVRDIKAEAEEEDKAMRKERFDGKP
jgi:hypothetical protein